MTMRLTSSRPPTRSGVNSALMRRPRAVRPSSRISATLRAMDFLVRGEELLREWARLGPSERITSRGEGRSDTRTEGTRPIARSLIHQTPCRSSRTAELVAAHDLQFRPPLYVIRDDMLDPRQPRR